MWKKWQISSLLGSKITADGDCSCEIRRWLVLGRKALTNLDSMLKSRDITLPSKVHIVKAIVFPVIMYGCESWTIKKVEGQRIYAFKLWCWRRLPKVHWMARSSNQSVLIEINPKYSLEGLMLKLKLQCFGLLTFHWKSSWCRKSWGQKEKRASEDALKWLNSITNTMNMNLGKL